MFTYTNECLLKRERCTVNWYRICFILCSLKNSYEQFIETNYNNSEREQERKDNKNERTKTHREKLQYDSVDT